ncbi:MAG: DUF2309 domain-containing protein [Deltaproteobacteria bacterium]|nr:DUF2309 domain-containing protein [Deltaproteobacteria bacterium]
MSVSAKDHVLHEIAHLAHYVPGQGPLSEFVHHNTLHGEQHLPFERAIRSANARTGADGTLSESAFLAHLRRGRIRLSDLYEAIDDRPGLNPQEVIHLGKEGVTRRELLMALLLGECDPVSPARLSWLLSEDRAEIRLAPGLDEHARRGVLESLTEDQAVSALWRVCLKVYGLGDPRAVSPEEDVWSRPVESALDDAQALAARVVSEIGQPHGLRELVLGLTGEDLYDQAHPRLIRWLSAFLDEGLAPWALGGREQGLWRAWREADPEAPKGLPDDPAEAIAAALTRLGVPQDRWGGVLLREALALPGFSAMVRWRELHPRYPAQVRAPSDLCQWLAMRLAVMAPMVEAALKAVFEGPLLPLEATFHRHAEEVLVRWALFHEGLPETVAVRARAVVARVHDAEEDEVGAWHVLAPVVAGARRALAEPRAETAAWPLFRLCQRLGISARRLLAMGEEGRAALTEARMSFPWAERAMVWQLAFEGRTRQEVLHGLHANQGRSPARVPDAAFQVAFCIDDREEAIRRHLEELSPQAETFGVAGFFGVAMRYKGLDDNKLTPLCPVVQDPPFAVEERAQDVATAAAHTAGLRGWERLGQLWQDVRRGLWGGLVASELLAPASAAAVAGLALDPTALSRAVDAGAARLVPPAPTRLSFLAPPQSPMGTPAAPRLGFTDEEQTDRVMGTLRNIGLLSGFSPLVIWMGHGSMSRNNPHLAAYDCGACSGRHGGPNARLFAAMANRPEVRARLAERGLVIPETTWFLGAEHNTADEAIDYYDLDLLPAALTPAFTTAKRALEHAARRSAQERCRKFEAAPRRPDEAAALAHVTARTLDITQARPELGHATNAIAVVGRRSMTRGLFLDRRAFLISYDPMNDPEGRVLEGILTAVGPVGAGINLEYYFSTVDNQRYGCGTKIPHNVMGLCGVMEGAGSDLRTGLPKQMIEVHEPVRLLLVVEANPQRLTEIVLRQPELSELVLGAWILAAAVDPADGSIHRFVAGRGFVPWTPSEGPPPTVARSLDWIPDSDAFLPPALIGGAAAAGGAHV